jgi:two-component system sensor histidine kinase QseC
MTESSPDGFEFEFQEAGDAEPDLGIPDLVFQIWRLNGEALLRSPRLGRSDLAHPPAGAGNPAYYDGHLPGGKPGHFIAWRFLPHHEPEHHEPDEMPQGTPRPEEPLLLVLGHSREGLDSTLRTLRTTVMVSVLALLGATLILVRLGLERGLAPLGELVIRLRGIDASRLDARADPEEAPAELRPFVEQLNALLGRLGDSFERERAFSANLAHELRTPISELRVLSEVALQDPTDLEVVKPLLEDARATAVQMGRIVDDLLQLARLESTRLSPDGTGTPPQPALLADLLLAAWRPVHAEAEKRGIEISLSGLDDVQVVADSSMLGLALANLLANAVRHGEGGNPVLCAAAQGAQGVELWIENRTRDLNAAALPHLFHRFWRKDAARSGGDNAGLGLPLVAAVCAQLGLSYRATLAEGSLFRITLSGFQPAPSSSLEETDTGRLRT